LKEPKIWRSYSQKLKEEAVKDYFSGQFWQREVTRKYEISDKKVPKSIESTLNYRPSFPE
jgi:transposase-like protein